MIFFPLYEHHVMQGALWNQKTQNLKNVFHVVSHLHLSLVYLLCILGGKMVKFTRVTLSEC